METVIRVVIIYIVIVAGLRVLGKREFSQLSAVELVLLLLIPELVAQALVTEDYSITNAIIAIFTLFVLVFISSLVTYHSKKAAGAIEGTPSILVEHGQFVTKTMNQQRVDGAEIFSEMHSAGLERLDQVKWAILETDGRISFIPYEETRGQVIAGGNEQPAL